MNSDRIKLIKDLAKPIIEKEDMYMLDVELKPGKETVVWIFVDAESGDVNVEACGRISRELGFVLDAHDSASGRYRLNVSSPGLDRPLTDERQYIKNIGRQIHCKIGKEDTPEHVEGVLKSVSDRTIEVQTGEDDLRTVHLEIISEAKIIPQI
ncbi:MAG: ribosome maturation factor [Balneolaceae bacterium]